MKRRRKRNRVIYRLWHDRSSTGLIGYVGKDSYYPKRSNLFSRKREGACKKLFLALNKYPLRFWRTEILKDGIRSGDSLIKAEIFYIGKFDSKNRGYNCTDGGEGAPGCSPSLETRKKISESKKNLSNETREKLSLAALGNKRCVDRTLSVETRKKIGLGNAGKIVSAASRKRMSKVAKLRWKEIRRVHQ
jgi:hypothetical protein